MVNRCPVGHPLVRSLTVPRHARCARCRGLRINRCPADINHPEKSSTHCSRRRSNSGCGRIHQPSGDHPYIGADAAAIAAFVRYINHPKMPSTHCSGHSSNCDLVMCFNHPEKLSAHYRGRSFIEDAASTVALSGNYAFWKRFETASLKSLNIAVTGVRIGLKGRTVLGVNTLRPL